MKYRVWAVIILIIGSLLGVLVFTSQNREVSFIKPFRLGLDLSGGTELVYIANVSDLEPGEIKDAMQALRDLVEKRVNLFGVSEPIVQIEDSGIFGGEKNHQLVVELPGITDVDEAVSMIGKTPVLEFKLVSPDSDESSAPEDMFIDTGLTGRFLSKARLEFMSSNQGGLGGEPYISLVFNDEGAELFADITRENVGRVLAVFLDGAPISAPVINEEITGGQAQITGTFTATEARELVRNLNLGALPVPIELAGTQSIGPTLGIKTVEAGVMAGIWSFFLISLFLILWYRLPGFVAVISLAIYAVLNLFLFQIIPVTLTAAGIAGFIMSIGIAVDSNILVFERIKEEIKKNKKVTDAVNIGFARAWTSIRDANVTGLISGVVLFWLGTSVVKGFALTLSIGILTSMLTAVVISRTLLLAISSDKISRFLFRTGFKK